MGRPRPGTARSGHHSYLRFGTHPLVRRPRPTDDFPCAARYRCSVNRVSAGTTHSEAAPAAIEIAIPTSANATPIHNAADESLAAITTPASAAPNASPPLLAVTSHANVLVAAPRGV